MQSSSKPFEGKYERNVVAESVERGALCNRVCDYKPDLWRDDYSLCWTGLMPLLGGVAVRSLCWTGLMPLLAFELTIVRAINIAAIVTIVDINSPFQIMDVRLMKHQRGEDIEVWDDCQ